MMKKLKNNNKYDYYLDITDDICPITFVRTKLLLERMAPGEIVEIRLKGQMPLQNVPRSVKEMGEIVLSLEPEQNGEVKAEDKATTVVADSVHRLVIQKAKR